MQGIDEFMPTANKVRYLNQLLKVGFDTIDFGSFVSPKVIPQMKDTSTVYRGLDLEHTTSKLLAIVANARGARDARRSTNKIPNRPPRCKTPSPYTFPYARTPSTPI